jgi:hypothetical protein
MLTIEYLAAVAEKIGVSNPLQRACSSVNGVED